MFAFITSLSMEMERYKQNKDNEIDLIFFFTEIFIESFSDIFQILQCENTTRECYVRNPIGRESDFTTNGALIIISSGILNIF